VLSSGKPVFSGTRIPVAVVVEPLRAGRRGDSGPATQAARAPAQGTAPPGRLRASPLKLLIDENLSPRLALWAAVQPITTAVYPTPAQQPSYSLLECAATRQALDLLAVHLQQV
jgi:hypothetical protein